MWSTSQPGHTAKDCRVAVYKIQEDIQEGYNDATEQWYGPQTTYDNHWWTDDQTQIHAVQHPQQRALPAPSQLDLDATPAVQIAAVPRNCSSSERASDMSTITNINKDELMIDSGAVTHVCPICLPQQHRHMTYQNKRGQTSEQQQKTPLKYTGTNGST